jgi:hypothetical protein
MKKEPILQLGTDKMIPRHVYDKLFAVSFSERREWKDGSQPDTKGGLHRYTHVSKQIEILGLGLMVMIQGIIFVSALGNTPQNAIKACAVRNLERDNINTRTNISYILSESQVLITALHNYQINSKLVWVCHQSIAKLAKYINKVQFIWVLGHHVTDGNETAEQLATLGSECPFIGTEQAFGRLNKKYQEGYQGLDTQRP